MISARIWTFWLTRVKFAQTTSRNSCVTSTVWPQFQTLNYAWRYSGPQASCVLRQLFCNCAMLPMQTSYIQIKCVDAFHIPFSLIMALFDFSVGYLAFLNLFPLHPPSYTHPFHHKHTYLYWSFFLSTTCPQLLTSSLPQLPMLPLP